MKRQNWKILKYYLTNKKISFA